VNIEERMIDDDTVECNEVCPNDIMMAFAELVINKQ